MTRGLYWRQTNMMIDELELLWLSEGQWRGGIYHKISVFLLIFFSAFLILRFSPYRDSFLSGKFYTTAL
jgi:hypothetical protein